GDGVAADGVDGHAAEVHTAAAVGQLVCGVLVQADDVVLDGGVNRVVEDKNAIHAIGGNHVAHAGEGAADLVAGAADAFKADAVAVVAEGLRTVLVGADQVALDL